MRKLSWIISSICFVLSVFFLPAVVSADDCGGSWRTLKNYQAGSGGPCKALGLNSRSGTCRPGDNYETLCDDSKGGKYKICKGPRRCNNDQIVDDRTNRDCQTWDYNYDQPCPAGFHNSDCKGGCDRKDCRTWDFRYNQPCPAGFNNSDCKGGCEKNRMILIEPSPAEEPSGLK